MSTMHPIAHDLQQPMAPPSNPDHFVGGYLADQPTPGECDAPFERTAFQFARFEEERGPSPADFRWSFGQELSTIQTAIDALVRGLADNRSPVKHAGAHAQAAIGSSNLPVSPNIALSGLKEVYVFEDRARVAAFVEQNRLRNLLLEAHDPLVAAFGRLAIKKLSLVEDDEGSETLFCSIAVSGTLDEARHALKSFDQGWWLAHCAKVGRKLNFDFELI